MNQNRKPNLEHRLWNMISFNDYVIYLIIFLIRINHSRNQSFIKTWFLDFPSRNFWNVWIPKKEYLRWKRFTENGSDFCTIQSMSSEYLFQIHMYDKILMIHFRSDDLLARISRSRNHPNTLNFMGTKLKLKEGPVCEGFLCLF